MKCLGIFLIFGQQQKSNKQKTGRSYRLSEERIRAAAPGTCVMVEFGFKADSIVKRALGVLKK